MFYLTWNGLRRMALLYLPTQYVQNSMSGGVTDEDGCELVELFEQHLRGQECVRVARAELDGRCGDGGLRWQLLPIAVASTIARHGSSIRRAKQTI
jgi:hypothetical protein